MKCPKCNSLDNQVNNTRTRLSTRGHNIDTKDSSIPFIWRSRTCLVCGNKYSTYEIRTQDYGVEGFKQMIEDLTNN